MSFFKKLFGGGGPEERQNDGTDLLRAITFEPQKKKLMKQGQGEVTYLTDNAVAYLWRLSTAPDWTWDLRDLESARAFYGDQCASANGAMLEMEICKIDNVEALRGLFKYRYPQNPLAIMYVGILWIPFSEYCLQLNIESVELGITGMREAIVMDLEIEAGTWVPPVPLAEGQAEPEPIMVKDGEDLLARMASTKLRKISSDDPKWDDKFSDHPLTKVRRGLDACIATIKLPEFFGKCTSYRTRGH